jgi:hypothetical protein
MRRTIRVLLLAQYFQEGAEPSVCSYFQQNPAEHLDRAIPRSQAI